MLPTIFCQWILSKSVITTLYSHHQSISSAKIAVYEFDYLFELHVPANVAPEALSYCDQEDLGMQTTCFGLPKIEQLWNIF